jgi:hypothetical protein
MVGGVVYGIVFDEIKAWRQRRKLAQIERKPGDES